MEVNDKNSSSRLQLDVWSCWQLPPWSECTDTITQTLNAAHIRIESLLPYVLSYLSFTECIRVLGKTETALITSRNELRTSIEHVVPEVRLEWMYCAYRHQITTLFSSPRLAYFGKCLASEGRGRPVRRYILETPIDLMYRSELVGQKTFFGRRANRLYGDPARTQRNKLRSRCQILRNVQCGWDDSYDPPEFHTLGDRIQEAEARAIRLRRRHENIETLTALEMRRLVQSEKDLLFVTCQCYICRKFRPKSCNDHYPFAF